MSGREISAQDRTSASSVWEAFANFELNLRVMRYHAAATLDRPPRTSRRRSLRRTSCGVTTSQGCFCTFCATASPIGETSYGPVMRLKDKLQILMTRHSLNGQKLAKLSQVSDSEISRYPPGEVPAGTGQRLPARQGRERLARFSCRRFARHGCEPVRGHALARERKMLNLTQKIGSAEVVAILENARFLGYELAMSRLIGARPIIEIDKEPTGRSPRLQLPSGLAPARQARAPTRRPAFLIGHWSLVSCAWSLARNIPWLALLS